MRVQNTFLIIISSILLVFGIIACSNDTSNKPENEASNTENANKVNNNNNEQIDAEHEDIVLKILFRLDENNFNQNFKDPIENEFPHIAVEYIPFNDTPEELEELITSKIFPDIYFNEHPINRINMWIDSGFAMDMDELIEKYGFDLNRISPSLVQQHRAMGNGSLYTLPLDSGVALLHYNKDIFDLFGVDYPKDEMTWEEVISLAREVTGERDGKHYYGLQLGDPSLMIRQLDVPYADPETDEPTYESDEYRDHFVEAFQLMNEIFSIPGNIPDENPESFVYDWGTRFVSERDVAMVVANQSIGWFSAEEFNFDVATLPLWEDKDNITQFAASSLGVSATSEHPEEALKVIEFMISEERQITRAREAGFSTVLEDLSVSEHLFADLVDDRPQLAEINLSALDKHTSTIGRDRSSAYDHIAEEAFPDMVQELIKGTKDVNTILREGQENAEKLIQEAKKME